MIIKPSTKLKQFLSLSKDQLHPLEENFHTWGGHLFTLNRRNCLLFTHHQSFYSVFLFGVTKKDIKTLWERLEETLDFLLSQDEFTEAQRETVLKSLEKVQYTAISNRRVTGIQNNMIQDMKYLFECTDYPFGEIEYSKHCNGAIYKPIDYKTPAEMMKKLVGEDTCQN